MRKEGENGPSGTRNTPEDFTPTISRNVLLHLHSASPKAVIYTVVAGFSSTSQNLPGIYPAIFVLNLHLLRYTSK